MYSTENLMERIVERENMRRAYRRVMANKGTAGVDGITVEDFPSHLKEHWRHMRDQLLAGRYRPAPVRRVPIPKRGGGTRELGIPTLTDRLIQQAILHVLTPLYDPTFSDASYGFRPRRNAHQAVRRAQRYIEEGYTTVVDLDLEKFFDTVHHNRLMATLARTIEDKRLLLLIRRSLQAGIMADGVSIRTTVGTPQGGPLSPLLANIVLDELDKELERRGHRFCRYADDCNIYVRTPKAGVRVMQSLTRFIERRLRLRVNRDKSAVDAPVRRQFLGFSFYGTRRGTVGIALARKTKERLTATLRALTRRRYNGTPVGARIERLDRYLQGWVRYFALSDCTTFLTRTEETLRRRLRLCLWTQWKRIRTRYANLRTLGMNHTDAIRYANTRKGHWRIAGSMILTTTLTNQYWRDLGLLPLVETYQTIRQGYRTAGYGTVRPVV